MGEMTGGAIVRLGQHTCDAQEIVGNTSSTPCTPNSSEQYSKIREHSRILPSTSDVLSCARCKLVSSSSFATTSSFLSRINVLMRFAWRAIVPSLVSAVLFWTEISRRLTSQPSQNPGTLRGPGLLNVSSRSTAGRRGAPGGRALAHVCLTCAPPHARQPPSPPP